MAHIGAQFDQVLAAARTGAGWAGERLWRSLAPSVAGYLRLQGAAEPDDLTSETFIGVLRGLDGFSGSEAQFRSWVFTIAHRRLVDERRRRGSRPVVVAPDPAEEVRPAAPSSEDLALGRLGTARVEALCHRLAPDQRDVLLLRLVAVMTVEEVAAVVGKTPGAVKALQRRGLASVRRLLEREGVPL